MSDGSLSIATIPPDALALILRLLHPKDLFTYADYSFLFVVPGRDRKLTRSPFAHRAQVVCRLWHSITWKCQLSLELPFTKAKFQAFCELSSLRALTLGSNGVFGESGSAAPGTFAGFAVPPGPHFPGAKAPVASAKQQSGFSFGAPSLSGTSPFRKKAQAAPPAAVRGDLLPLVPALGASLRSLIINKGLNNAEWKAFGSAAFDCFGTGRGSLTNLTRLDVQVLEPESDDIVVAAAQGISRTCPEMTHLKLLIAGSWNEAFSALIPLHLLERLETSSPTSGDWGCLRSLPRLKYLGVSSSHWDSEKNIRHILSCGLCFVPLYAKDSVLLLGFVAESASRVLDEYEKQGLTISRHTALNILLESPRSPLVHEHPLVVKALHANSAVPDNVFRAVLARAATGIAQPRPEQLHLLYALLAPYLKGGDSFGRELLPRSIASLLRSWVQSRSGNWAVVLRVLELIPNLLDPAEKVSVLLSLGLVGEALCAVRAEFAKGLEFALELVLADKQQYEIYVEPLHAILQLPVESPARSVRFTELILKSLYF